MKLSQMVLDVLHGRLCPYCNTKTVIMRSSDNSSAYMGCKTCDAYAYIDSGVTLNTKGRLANSELWFERQLAEHQMDLILTSGLITVEEVWDMLKGELGLFEPYLDLYYLKLENVRKMTICLLKKRMFLEYEQTKSYVNYSAYRKMEDGKKRFKKCYPLKALSYNETLVEFEDGFRDKVKLVRVTRT